MSIIQTHRSGISCAQECMRKRWHVYESPNGTKAGGFERLKLALPLATGIYVHTGIGAVLLGTSIDDAVKLACDGYKEEIASRGLETEVLDQMEDVISEQNALIEALVRAWNRIRLPYYLENYDIVAEDIEREESVLLIEPDSLGVMPGVELLARTDALLRRKLDGKLFIANWKTVGSADYRWYQGWEVDMQILTETLAVEKRLGERLGGVIVEGLIKGARYKVKDKEGEVIGYRQGTPLIYGYKHPGNPPIDPPAYDFNYTKRKGWSRFNVWEEKVEYVELPAGTYTKGEEFSAEPQPMSSIAWWIDWLPEELLEAQFAIVPPLLRDQAVMESKVRQIVAIERQIYLGKMTYEQAESDEQRLIVLDNMFPQNERACIWPSKCSVYDICWTGGVSADPIGSGLFRARIPHHPQEGKDGEGKDSDAN